MTRRAVADGFERFVDRAIALTAAEFDIGRALRGHRGLGRRATDRLGRSETLWSRVVQPELDEYRERILAQFEVLLDCVERGADVETRRDRLLTRDAYVAALRDDLPPAERERIEERLLERQRRLGEAVAPLVAAPQEGFWPAVTAVLTRAEAKALVEERFAFTRPLREERAAFEMTISFDAGDVLGRLGAVVGGLARVEVAYTDEALRAMGHAERVVVEETVTELDAQFG